MKNYIHEKIEWLKQHPNPVLRISIGSLLVAGGVLGALPIVGFWMLPLGLVLLAVDFPWAKRAHNALMGWLRNIKVKYFKRSADPQSQSTDNNAKRRRN